MTGAVVANGGPTFVLHDEKQKKPFLGVFWPKTFVFSKQAKIAALSRGKFGFSRFFFQKLKITR